MDPTFINQHQRLGFCSHLAIGTTSLTSGEWWLSYDEAKKDLGCQMLNQTLWQKLFEILELIGTMEHAWGHHQHNASFYKSQSYVWKHHTSYPLRYEFPVFELAFDLYSQNWIFQMKFVRKLGCIRELLSLLQKLNCLSKWVFQFFRSCSTLREK